MNNPNANIGFPDWTPVADDQDVNLPNGKYLVTYHEKFDGIPSDGEWSMDQWDIPPYETDSIRVMRVHDKAFRLPQCLTPAVKDAIHGKVTAYMPCPIAYGTTPEIEYFCAGLIVDKFDDPKFALMRCSGSNGPYIVKDANNAALRLTGHTASLYGIDMHNKFLYKINDKHYGLDGCYAPRFVMLDADMFAEIESVINSQTFLDKE